MEIQLLSYQDKFPRNLVLATLTCIILFFLMATEVCSHELSSVDSNIGLGQTRDNSTIMIGSNKLTTTASVKTNLVKLPEAEIVNALKPKLNSERIEYFFGSYGVEPLNTSQSIFLESRISNLYSIHDNKKIMRTLAIVDYVKSMDPRLIQAHKNITAGASIGTALREAGWTIIKQPIYFGETSLSEQVKQWMHEKDHNKGAVHIYQLKVTSSTQLVPIPYCTIIEIHSPQYLTLEWLKALYDKEYSQHHEADASLNILLGRVDKLFKSFDEQSYSLHATSPTIIIGFNNQRQHKANEKLHELRQAQLKMKASL